MRRCPPLDFVVNVARRLTLWSTQCCFAVGQDPIKLYRVSFHGCAFRLTQAKETQRDDNGGVSKTFILQEEGSNANWERRKELSLTQHTMFARMQKCNR